MLESYGHYAIQYLRRNALAKAEKMYADAIADHNNCVAMIKTGLDTGMDKTVLEDRLKNADVSRTKLIDWCKRMAREISE